MKQCTVCFESKNESEFLFNRTSGPYPYHLNYCNKCRYEQICNSLNKDVNAYLKYCFARLRTRCKNKKILFNLTLEYFLGVYAKQNGKCFYTEQEMVMKVGKGSSWDAFTIDRVIPENGYTFGNIVFCKKRINTSKHQFSLNEMMLYMPAWYDKIMKANWLEVN